MYFQSFCLMNAIGDARFLVPLCHLLLHDGAPRVEVEEGPRPQDGGGAQQPAEERSSEPARQHVLGGDSVGLFVKQVRCDLFI